MGMFFLLITGLRIGSDPYVREDGLSVFIKVKEVCLAKLFGNKFFIKTNLQ
jgi:hypothetical protein